MRPKFTAMNTNDSDKNSWLSRTFRPGHSLAALLPIMATVFIAFLVIGIAIPVLPLYVHRGLESVEVNCQSALALCLLRSDSQAAISVTRVCMSGMRRSRHCDEMTLSSDSAMSSQLACLGV